MLDTLKALVIDYQMFYGLSTLEEAMKYIKEDLKFLVDFGKQERDYNIISKGNTNTDTEYLSVQA